MVEYRPERSSGTPAPGTPPAPDGASEAVEWEAAYQHALWSLRTLPEPGDIALWLPQHLREALLNAYRGRDGWRVSSFVPELRLAGLVEVGGTKPNLESRNHLGAMGNEVRKLLVAAEKF